jgi:hypothetical protein
MHLPVPRPEDLPAPIVIDSSSEEHSTDNNLETRHETTVYFPQLGNINECRSNTEMLRQALSSYHSERITLNAEPSTQTSNTWEPVEFVKAFVRQFPYGYGIRPSSMKLEVYIKHLVTLSINAFQRADFILIAANIYFKQAIVSKSSLKTKHKLGNKTAIEVLNNIDVEEIDNVLENPELIQQEPSSNISYFLRSVFAVSRCLPFSDQAERDFFLKD